MGMDLERAYQTLQLDPGAGPVNVKRAYRRMAKLWHPDRCPHGGRQRREFEAKMRAINEAYDLLKALHGNGLRAAPAEPAPAEPEPPHAEQPPPRAEPPPEPEPEPAEAEAKPEAQAETTDIRPWFDPNRWEWRRKPRGGPRWSPFGRRHPTGPGRTPDYAAVTRLSAAFFFSNVVMGCFFLLRSPTSESYYLTLRLVVCLSTLYAASCAFSRRLWDLGAFLLVVAMLFNPALPVRFEVEEWRLVNLLTPFFLIYAWFRLVESEMWG